MHRDVYKKAKQQVALLESKVVREDVSGLCNGNSCIQSVLECRSEVSEPQQALAHKPPGQPGIVLGFALN